MHAKAHQVTRFLEQDLLGSIQEAFGEADEARIAEARASHAAARKQAEDFGSLDPDAAPKVKEAKEVYDAVKDSSSNEGDVYDHLYRFFRRLLRQQRFHESPLLDPRDRRQGIRADRTRLHHPRT
jgi:adenine-specific DNA-methyltransferase